MRLYSKVMLCVGGAAGLATLGIVLHSQRLVHAALVDGLAQVGRRECEEVAQQAAAAVAAGDENRLLPLLHAVMAGSGASSVAALDARGRVAAHSDVTQTGRVDSDPLTLEALAAPAPLARELRRGGRETVELYFPVRRAAAAEEEFLLSRGGDASGERVGTLRVSIPLDDALGVQRRITRDLLRSAVAMVGAGLLLALALMRRLLAPIASLAAGTVKIGDGDYGAQVPVMSSDELGELARSFNRMARELAMTTVSKQFLHDVLHGIQDLVVVTDEAGRVTLVNPAASALLGRPPEEMLGRDAQELLADGLVEFRREARNASARLRARSGELIPVLLSCAPIKGATGAVTGWIGSARDVRDVRQLEARMRQSEKLSAVGQLAAGVAHEINNPLGVILGFAQAMSRQLAAQDPLELPVRSIEREALRCKALVQNLLTFARTSQPDRVAMAVNPAVEQAMSLVLPQARMAQVAVTAELAPELPPVLGNKNQLEQVVLNLAKNAIDAMPNGGRLRVSTDLETAAPHSWVRLRFEDDGTGIPPELMSRIFDPFFTTKPVGQGTGLGLSLVGEIVQKHSGELSVESRPGRTVFTVRLPARTGEEMERRRLEERDAARREQERPRGSIAHG